MLVSMLKHLRLSPSSTLMETVGPLLCFFLLGGLVLSTTAKAQHPTSVTSIVNSAADTSLEVNHNGSLLLPGAYNPTSPNDSIPTTGAGTRLMWYPAKAAFRAGRVGRYSDGTLWNASKVGDYSVAFGIDTKASNVATTAMGFETIASGNRSTAMGAHTTASGLRATAMGSNTTAATENSLSIGQCNSANTSSDGTLFVVGNGFLTASNTCESDDALTLDNNGNLTISGNLTEGSDRRLKTAIQPLKGGTLAKISELRPVRYQFKNQRSHPSGEQIGLIAQDVRKEFPALISEGSGGYLSLAYPKLTAVLVKGLQEQQSTVEKQKQQIRTLKAENKEIKKRLAALEARQKPTVAAGLFGPWGLALLMGLGGVAGTLLWRRQP